MATAVREHVIGPMLALYPAPQHLRGDARKCAAALAAYEVALGRFDAATLAAGWAAVTAEHRFWVWPNPGVVAEACGRFAPPPPAPGDQEERRERAEVMADAYAARFLKTTHLAKLAAAEGWAARLGEYVREAAWVQAQVICGVRGVSFGSALVPPEQRHLPARELLAKYCESAAGAVGRGRVRVAVPPSRVREWRREAGRGASGPAGYTRPTALPDDAGRGPGRA